MAARTDPAVFASVTQSIAPAPAEPKYTRNATKGPNPFTGAVDAAVADGKAYDLPLPDDAKVVASAKRLLSSGFKARGFSLKTEVIATEPGKVSLRFMRAPLRKPRQSKPKA